MGMYADQAAASTIPELTKAMEALSRFAQSELSMAPRLEDAARMWQQAGAWVGEVQSSFKGAVDRMMPHWPAKTDAPLFQERANVSTTSLDQSHQVINGGVQDALRNLPGTVTQTANTVQRQLELFNELIAEYNKTAAVVGARGSDVSVVEKQYVPQFQQIVRGAGVALETLATAYTSATPTVAAAGNGVRWIGPRAGGQNGAGGAAGPGGQNSRAAGGGDASAAGGGAGGAAGDSGGAAGGAAGAGGGTAGAGGDANSAVPPAGSNTGGTGLAGGGVGTLPPAQTAIPGHGIGTIPPGGFPVRPNTIPPGGLPLLPIAGSGKQLPAARGTTSGSGKFTPLPRASSGHGGGGGGLGHARLGDAKTAIRQGGGRLDQSIPRAAKTFSGPTPTAGGQGQALPTSGNALAGTSSGQSGSSAPPPMMPPGGMAGGGGSRGGKSGNGSVRPGGPGRTRPAGVTPGVPAGLRGRTSKKDEQASFPMAPPMNATKKQRRQKDEIETLQLLDEELWEVDETNTSANPAVATSTPQQRRLAR